MGKFRGHQDKSRRGREKKLLKKKASGGGGRGVQADTVIAGSPGGPGRQMQRQQAKAGVGVGVKRKLKHVTYAKEHSVLICGDGDFSFTRGVIRHRGTGCVSSFFFSRSHKLLLNADACFTCLVLCMKPARQTKGRRNEQRCCGSTTEHLVSFSRYERMTRPSPSGVGILSFSPPRHFVTDPNPPFAFAEREWWRHLWIPGKLSSKSILAPRRGSPSLTPTERR